MTARRSLSSQQFSDPDTLVDVSKIPFGAGFGSDDPHAIRDSGPQLGEYNHPEHFHRDRQRYEAAKKDPNKGFVDMDKRRVQSEMKQRDKATAQEHKAEEAEHDQRVEERHDVYRAGGGALVFAAGLAGMLRQSEVPIPTKVAR